MPLCDVIGRRRSLVWLKLIGAVGLYSYPPGGRTHTTAFHVRKVSVPGKENLMWMMQWVAYSIILLTIGYLFTRVYTNISLASGPAHQVISLFQLLKGDFIFIPLLCNAFIVWGTNIY